MVALMDRVKMAFMSQNRLEEYFNKYDGKYSGRGLPENLDLAVADQASSIIETCSGWLSDTLSLSPLRASNTSGTLGGGRLDELLRNPSEGKTQTDLMEQTINGFIHDGKITYVYYEDQILVADRVNAHTTGSNMVNVWLRPAKLRKFIQVPRENLLTIAYRVDKNGQAYTPIKSVQADIVTDYIRAWRTGTLLHNESVPNAIISPPDGTFSKKALDEIMQMYQDAATFKRGRAQGFTRPINVQFPPGTNLKSIDMRAVAWIAEERICAVLRVAPQVVNLGVGLETTKVGATLHEAILDSWRGAVEPMQKRIETALSGWLPPLLGMAETTEIRFDNSEVPVLRNELERMRNEKSARLLAELEQDLITEEFYREEMRYEVIT